MSSITVRIFTMFNFLIVILNSYVAFAAAPSSTILRTIIKDPNDAVLESAAVNFRITYVDPVGTCVLYVEDFSNYNMTGAKGLALLSLGTGTQVYPVAAYSYENVYDNSRSFTCQGGGTYVAASNDVRKVIMQFNDGNGWQTLPAVPVTSVPFSIFAETAQVAKSVSGMPTCVAGQSISFNGASFSCVAVGTGTVLSVTSAGAPIAIGGTATNPTVAIAQASAGVSGYVSSSDWNTFNSKMSNGLTNARIWIGSVANVAAAVQVSGDATLDNAGTLTLSNSGVAAGSNYTKFTVDAKGRVTSASSITSADITALGFSTSNATNLSLNDGLIFVGNTGNVATGVVLSGDATIDNAGVLTLRTTGVVAGSNYSKFNVDAKGRLTSAGSLTSGDIISILGYTPGANAVSNTGSGAGNIIISMQSGANGSKPAAGTDGRMYVSTDTQEIYRDNGSVWVKVAGVGGMSAAVNTISVGSGPLIVGGTSSDPNISISQATSSSAGYLSSADWNIFNNKLSSISSADVTTALSFTPLSNVLNSALLWIGNSSNNAAAVALSGDARIDNLGNLTLQSSAVTRGNLGLGTAAALNVNGIGNALSTEVVQGNDSRLTDARLPLGAAGGDLSGSYPNPILANSGVTAGTYSKVEVDAKGRVISASNLTSADIAATGFASSGASSQWTTSGADISYSAGNVSIGTTSGAYALTVSSDTIGVGTGIVKMAANNIVNIGIGNSVGYNNSIAIGRWNSTGSADTAVAIGYNNNAAVDMAVGIGSGNTAGNAAVAIGRTTQANSAEAVAIGIGVSNSIAYSLQIGPSDSAKSTILSNGYVGIGTQSPQTTLDVAGSIRSAQVSIVDPSITGIDFATGNIQYTSVSCAGLSWNVVNLKEGATYTFAVQGNTHSGACIFAEVGSTFKYQPANATPENGKDVIYTLLKIGSVVYVSWIDGW